MRLQLILACVVAATVASSSTAHADGTLAMRGVYYKERSTRVIQPMLDAMFEAGAHGMVSGHFLVDAITSASPSSGAVAATPFSEKRIEAGGAYVHELEGPEGSILDVLRLGAESRFSNEPDYRSIFAGARLEAELAQKNAVVGLGGGVSFDEVNNKGSQSPMGGPKLLCANTDPVADATQCPLHTYSLFTMASHLLSPNALVGVGYDLAKSHGFLSNAYRQVITDTGLVPEREPNDRMRQAIAISGRFYVPSAKLAIVPSYRYYWDDWDVHAHTPEIRLIEDINNDIDASIRYRYYTQDAAFFYAKHYPDQNLMPSAYLTDDPKLTAFDGHLFEAKLGVLGDTFGLKGRWAGARIEGILEYIIQNNRFGNAVVAHASLTVPFEY